MATNGCSPIQFFSTTETAFYFAEESDVDSDAFERSLLSSQRFIRSIDNKFLILNAEGEMKATNLTEAQLQPDHKFNIQVYKDSTLGGNKGRAVMMYVKKGDKTMVVCCNEKHEICPEQMDLPCRIDQSRHKAVFYRREVSSSKYSFESSLYPSEFMAFECDEQNSTLYKLVLRPCKDQVDDWAQVILS